MAANYPTNPSLPLPRLGLIGPRDELAEEPLTNARLQALSDLGWVDGKSIIVNRRFANNDESTIPGIVRDLINSGVDVIWAATTAVAKAASAATNTIPIVMDTAGDPVRSGLVASLQHPGRNLTGTTALPPSVSTRQFLLLLQLVPGATLVGVLHAGTAAHTESLALIQTVAPSGVNVQPFVIGGAQDVQPAFAALRAASARGWGSTYRPSSVVLLRMGCRRCTSRTTGYRRAV